MTVERTAQGRGTMNMTLVTLWPVSLEALQALGKQYYPEMDRVAAELSLPEWYGWLLPALAFEPEPISATKLRLRSPYTSPRLYSEISPPWIFARGVSFGVGRLDRMRLGGRERRVSNNCDGESNSPDCRRAYRSVLLLALVLLDSSRA